MDDETKAVVTRESIEERAVIMVRAFAVENESMAALRADPAQNLALLHGIRFGAMAAIEQIQVQTSGEDE